MVKVIATESAMSVLSHGVQIMGGKGYMKDGPIERIFRDIKVYCIFDGTTQAQKMVISGAVLSGRGHQTIIISRVAQRVLRHSAFIP